MASGEAKAAKAAAQSFKAAVVQMTTSSDHEENFKIAAGLCEDAEKEGVKLLCFPECFAFLGLGAEESKAFAQKLSGDMLKRYASLAKKHKLYLSLGGIQEKVDDGPDKIANSHVIVDPEGQILCNYRKIHLFDVDVPNGRSFRESSFTVAGKELVVVKNDEVGNLGVSICYDVRFPEMYAKLRERGAQLLLIPATFAMKTGMAHWEILLRSRAIENQCYVLAAAQSGKHNAKRYKELKKGPPRESYGNSCIIDPWGTVIARASNDSPCLVIAKIDLARVGRMRLAMPVSEHRRPDIYHATSAAEKVEGSPAKL
eukprot:jgi/Bigna1/134180/aug1.24_g8888